MQKEWNGSQCPIDPDNFWIDDDTGERVNAISGERNRISWAPEVSTDSTGKFYGNALRFATEGEALASARELSGRWLLVRDYRAAPSSDPVTWSMPDLSNPRDIRPVQS